jgi:hypothetical protein
LHANWKCKSRGFNILLKSSKLPASASERLSLVPDLVQSSADQLDYSTAISYIDTELESLTGATKDEWNLRRSQLVYEQDITAKVFK